MDAELATLLAQDFATQKLRAEEKQHQLRTEIDTLKQELRTARKSILANTTTPTVDNIDLGRTCVVRAGYEQWTSSRDFDVRVRPQVL